ncbi:hypothetical protein GGI17_000652, partial [Coemansia sp. S146]
RSIGIKHRRYYFNEVVCHADHLFGRHTRCFLAADTKPTVDSPLVPTVVIKDAWAFAECSISKDTRDETKMLKKIRATLDEHISPDDDIIYPKIVVGGRVSFVHGRTIEDNTNTMYQWSDLAGKDSDHFRVHRRIVMLQIGQRLHTLESVDEFITVVCDVMRYRMALRGLLIDFDCALDTSIERMEPPHQEMTGTLPFMSINNLSESNVKRTILDDYESMLYLVCCNFGILDVSKPRAGRAEAYGRPVSGAHASASVKPVTINPFEKRVKKCDIIAKELLAVIDGYWEAAKQEQNRPKLAPEEQVETATDDDKDDEDDAVKGDDDDD